MRKVLFWFHLTTGVIAGIIVFVMCVTGALLSFERQTLDWINRHEARVIPPTGSTRLPVAALIAKSGATPDGVLIRSDPTEPVEIYMPDGRTIYMNPFTGAITGAPSKQALAFFQSIRQWHRWVAINKSTRDNTRPIYDAANLLLLFMVISGPFLWWPKRLTWQHVRPIVWFRGGLSSKARDFNWHNTLGLWMSIPLAIIVASGVVMSYSWATNLLFRITGSELPKREQPQPMPKGELTQPWLGADTWLAHAQSQIPGWRTIALRNAPTRTVEVFVDSGSGGEPQKRAWLTLDRVTGAEVKRETFDGYTQGLKLRVLARVAHTGEVGGVPLQALACLACLSGALLVYTGFALSLRRFVASRRRKAKSAAPEVVEAT